MTATTDHQAQLKKRQDACQIVNDRMIERLIGYAPCGKLAVDDVLYIARDRTVAGVRRN